MCYVGCNGHRRLGPMELFANNPGNYAVSLLIVVHHSVLQGHVHVMAACCLGLFGFLRFGVFTCPSLGSYILTPEDVHVDSYSDPSVHLKADPFGKRGNNLSRPHKSGDMPCWCTSGLLRRSVVSVRRWFTSIQ